MQSMISNEAFEMIKDSRGFHFEVYNEQATGPVVFPPPNPKTFPGPDIVTPVEGMNAFPHRFLNQFLNSSSK